MKRKKRKKRKKKKRNNFVSVIEKNHKNIWKLRSNGGVVGNFKREKIKNKKILKKERKEFLFLI